jgi:hypothetical protein
MTRKKDSFIEALEAYALPAIAICAGLSLLNKPGGIATVAPIPSNAPRESYMPVGLGDEPSFWEAWFGSSGGSGNPDSVYNDGGTSSGFDFDEYDTGLGGLGEIVNYPYYTPPAPPAPTTPYNTVSDDERAYGRVQQPAREFSIWDSVTKPGKKARTPTHSTTRRTPTKNQRHTSPSVASSNRSNSEFVSPVIEPPIINDTRAIHQPEPAQGISPTTLIVGAGLLVGAFFMARS